MVTLLLFAGAQLTLLAQEPTQPPEGIPPESDYMYRTHYAEVEQLMKGALTGRFSALQTYAGKLHPKSKILQYVSAFYLQIARDLDAAGNGTESSRVMAYVRDKYPEAAVANDDVAQSPLLSLRRDLATSAVTPAHVPKYPHK